VLLFVVGLSASGYANQFYAAAAQAGSTNWEAFLWGSSDAGNSITVDKPPASLWVMALSVRVFGLSSWSILVPQAIMGVLAVYLVYATVRRSFGEWCGLLAGALLATTPIACLMFRFDNPDALLVLLLCAATYCLMRALEYDPDKAGNRARTRWMALAGVAMGFGFLTKQLQAFLILPALGVTYLVASPAGWRRRWLDAAVALGALVASAGWWVLLTVVVPASERPYIGGSQTNSFLELTFSYNGLGRISGTMTGAVVPGNTGATTGQSSMWGATGVTRLFDGVWGTQWSWIAPLAFVGIVVVIVAAGRARRCDLRRANAIMWGGWLLATWGVFSFMGGTIHQYYTVALAPAAAALAAMCVKVLWERREQAWARVLALALTAGETVWGVTLMERSDWMVPLRMVAFGLGAAGIVLQVVCWVRSRRGAAAKTAVPTGGGAPVPPMAVVPEVDPAPAVAAVAADDSEESAERPVRLEAAALALSLAAALVGPVAWTLYTASTAHTGSIVTAGPSVTSSDGGMGGGMGQGGGGMQGEAPSGDGGSGGSGSAPSGMGEAPSGDGMGGGMPSDGGGKGSVSGSASASGDGMGGMPSDDGSGSAHSGMGGGSMEGGPSGSGGGSSLLGGDTNVSDELVATLSADSGSYTWVAAANGSQSAAGYQLATQLAVMPVGGFNGSDPSPTLDEFKEYVAEGRIHYYISGGQGSGKGGFGAEASGGSSSESSSDESASSTMGGGMTQLGGSQAASDIESWVQSSFQSTTVDGVTLYDLTKPLSTS
jgi:4-amino-4-deoxy-L-arabinose transferase-like glycosyltransferase